MHPIRLVSLDDPGELCVVSFEERPWIQDSYDLFRPPIFAISPACADAGFASVSNDVSCLQ